MLWEGKALRDIREVDLRRIVESGLEEHLQLEYKSALYDDNLRGRKEFLLDVAMFANAAGGTLLLGVPERRDEDGQPTGVPDPAGVLGLELPNQEAILNAYDARVMEAIEERLPLESASVAVGNGRRVLALRVMNSARKPHSVRHEGHIYFPSRRERQRYHMNVREIKELVMRTASRLEEAKEMLRAVFNGAEDAANEPIITVAMIPVFSEDFLVDVRAANVRRTIAEFSPRGADNYREPVYTFDGIERNDPARGTVKLRRKGLLSLRLLLPLIPARPGEGQDRNHTFAAAAIDLLLRNFLLRATRVYEAARVDAPFVLSLTLNTRRALFAAYPSLVGGYEEAGPLPAGNYFFPYMQVVDLSKINVAIRPLCDQASQMFGRQSSPSFDDQGEWVARQ
jgi:hypothetical protein